MKKALVLIGPPGSGKTTQRDRVVEKYGFKSISTGNVVRRAAEENPEIEHIINEGKLLPDEMMEKIIKKEISESEGRDMIFDGYPRDEAQAKTLTKITDENDFSLNVIFIRVSREEVFKRLGKRYICEKCGTASTSPGICSCGEKLTKREDDKPEVIEERMDIFEENSKPIVEYYRNRGELLEIDGEGSFDEVTQRIFHSLDKYYKKISVES